MSALELKIRRWIFQLGQRLVIRGKGNFQFGHYLCGRAIGIRSCCIRHFQSYEHELGIAARLYKLENEFDKEWDRLDGHPELQYAPCPWHRGAAQYPILVLFERKPLLEEVLDEWSKEFWRRAFGENPPQRVLERKWRY
ncbi:MAG: hypothetical protein WAL95_04870 [Candidatus Acidiferrales bacterium]